MVPPIGNIHRFRVMGRYVAFASDQLGRSNIWIRELATGKESSVANSAFVQRYPLINSSGARIAFSVFEKDKRTVYVSALGGAPEILCEGCLRATDWSRDDKTVLVFGGNPYQIDVVDVSSHQQSPLLKHPNHHLLYGRFSPDNRWVAFTVRTQPDRGHIAIAPLSMDRSQFPKAPGLRSRKPRLKIGPTGRLMDERFTSPPAEMGITALGQHIEESSHWPVGDAFEVQHFHGDVAFRYGGWSAAGGRIASRARRGNWQHLDDVPHARPLIGTAMPPGFISSLHDHCAIWGRNLQRRCHRALPFAVLTMANRAVGIVERGPADGIDESHLLWSIAAGLRTAESPRDKHDTTEHRSGNSVDGCHTVPVLQLDSQQRALSQLEWSRRICGLECWAFWEWLRPL